MARVGSAASNTSSTAEGTPVSDELGPKDGIHLTRPRTDAVEDYPERSYRDAVTADHLELLRESGQEPA